LNLLKVLAGSGPPPQMQIRLVSRETFASIPLNIAFPILTLKSFFTTPLRPNMILMRIQTTIPFSRIPSSTP
jgi:hypothetical protein